MTGRDRILQEDRPAMRPVETHSKTRVIVVTKLLTDGENWQVNCSCGWKTPVFRRRQTARRHYDAHKDAHK